MQINDYLPDLKYTESGNFFLIAGPCVIEDESNPWRIAEKLVSISDKYSIPFIFKASFKKANRSKSSSFTGIGDIKALELLRAISKKFSIPVITDIHSESDAVMASEYADVLQIPAFLCRQSSLLEAAGKTGKVVNIKKGQFASAETMQFAAEKVRETGNSKIILTERGSMFGYHDLLVDYRNIPEMQKSGVPVVLDVTHSLQIPNQSSGVTGGRPDLIPTIAKAGIAVGVDGLFIETHPDPANAKSDGANMLPLDQVEVLMEVLIKIRRAIG
jgi:2-dehydro-3-deoxyphosphooctonate aldolase (KDO 8-P synthase)